MSEYRDLERKLNKYLQYWKPALGLNLWDIRCNFIQDWAARHPDDKGDSASIIDVSWEYLYARIDFNMPCMKNDSDDDLEGYVIHELVHCVVKEMQSENVEHGHVERAVTSLTLAFIFTRDKERKAKDATHKGKIKNNPAEKHTNGNESREIARTGGGDCPADPGRGAEEKTPQ